MLFISYYFLIQFILFCTVSSNSWNSRGESAALDALKTNINNSGGTAVTWSGINNGGIAPDSELTSVETIYSTSHAFAAVKTNGKVVAWGNPNFGGEAPDQADGLIDVEEISSTESAFAALKTDGTVVAWGKLENENKSTLGVTGLEIYYGFGGVFVGFLSTVVFRTFTSRWRAAKHVGVEVEPPREE